MSLILSTYLYVGQKLVPALLDEIREAGVGAVEIFSARTHFDYRSVEDVRKLADWFGSHDLKLHALHAPTSREFSAGREGSAPMSISDVERIRRQDAVDEVKRTLEVAEQIPFRYLVQHLGSGRESAEPRKYEAAFSSLEHLAVFAKQRGVTIAVENTPGELALPSNLRHFLQDTRLDVRFCFDAGHAHMEDGVGRGLEAMSEWVVTAHIHDNHGEKDEHLLPFEGTIDWPALMKSFSRIPVSGGLPVVFELKEAAVPAEPLPAVTAVWHKLQAGGQAGAAQSD